MKKVLRVKKLLFLFILFVIFNINVSAEPKHKKVIFIANKDISTDQLSLKEIRHIFLGKKRSWNKKTKVNIVLNTSEDAEKVFLKIIGKTKSKYEKYWEKRLFTGKGTIPTKINNQKELLEFLEKTPGSISYISQSDSLKNKDIKIIKIKSE